MRELADKVIDTSTLNVHELKREMEQQFCQAPYVPPHDAVFLTSFGYKFGIPHDTDMIFDVRFLPNPYFVSELRAKERLGARSRRIRPGNAETRTFLDRLYDLLEFALPLYEREGKSSLTLGPGLHRRAASFCGFSGRVAEKIGRRQIPHPRQAPRHREMIHGQSR